jgi:hypothetical protein
MELLVSLCVLGVITALGAGALSSEQRNARGAARLRAVRAEIRDATSIIAHDLRGASPLSDTLRIASDTAVEFFAPVLTAITCAQGSGTRLLLVPPASAADGTLSAIGGQPDTGDLVWIWEEDSLRTPGFWRRRRVAAYAAGSAESCDPHLQPIGSQPHVLTVLEDAGSVPAGAPVQLVRRGRYSVYRASDGAWYLGYRRCDALGPSRCQAVQPVAGPYHTPAGGESGVAFRYFGESGAELTGAAAETGTWRIEAIVRSDTSGSALMAGRAHALGDSVAMIVGLRNAR